MKYCLHSTEPVSCSPRVTTTIGNLLVNWDSNAVALCHSFYGCYVEFISVHVASSRSWDMLSQLHNNLQN